MKTTLFCYLILTLNCTVTCGEEVEKSHRTGIIEKAWDEEKREEIVSVFGDLTKFSFLWVRPENGLQVSAVMEIKKDNKLIYDVLFWRGGLRKDQIVSTRLSNRDSEALLRAINILSGVAKEAKEGKESKPDLENQERILIFMRYKNVDVFDWHCISVRSNSQNEHFKLIQRALIPISNAALNSELDEFLQKQK